MLLRSTLLATASLALLATLTEAHSWADCVDWRFNDPKKPGWTDKHGKCFGWARQYPVKSGVPFGDLDSYSPNRHYQQDPDDFTPCSDGVHGREDGADETRQNPISKAYGGKFGTMASTYAGDEICVRWPAKNHAVENEEDRGVFINMPATPLTRDPNQSQFMKANIAKLRYKNCNHIKGDSDHTPCGGCFTVPKDRKPGTYVVQWRWELNDDEWYTSCWDLRVLAKEPPPPPPPQPGVPGNSTGGGGKGGEGTPGDQSTLSGATSLFAQLAEYL